ISLPSQPGKLDILPYLIFSLTCLQFPFTKTTSGEYPVVLTNSFPTRVTFPSRLEPASALAAPRPFSSRLEPLHRCTRLPDPLPLTVSTRARTSASRNLYHGPLFPPGEAPQVFLRPSHPELLLDRQRQLERLARRRHRQPHLRQ